MANPAINAALLVAAQQQAQSAKALTDQLVKARALSARTAIPLELSAKGSGTMLQWLVKRGHIREAGGGRYWLDEEAISAAKSRGLRVALILSAFALSAGASLLALAR